MSCKRNRLDVCRIVVAFWMVCVLSAAGSAARATTAPDVRARIGIDGYTNDFAPDENIFGNNGAFTSVESATDSKWGSNEEVLGIRVTWDHWALYLAVEGRCWDNNVILLIDAVPNQGLSGMANLNTWRRNFAFSPDLAPDLFVVTWDRNVTPRLLSQIAGSAVGEESPGAFFQAVASFNQDGVGRSMEARIPWTTLFRFSSNGSVLVRDTIIAGFPDTLVFLPPSTQLRVVAAITGGSDGTGGPDVAPDNSLGCSADGNALVQVDNFAIVELDADHDGLPDIGVSPLARVSFKNLAVPARNATWGELKARYH